MNLPGYDESVICPYNNTHVILKSRFQTHLVRCARSYPNIRLEICPFDVTHRFRAEDKQVHIVTCPSRETFDRYRFNFNAGAPAAPLQPSRPPQPPVQQQNDEESWDHYDVPTYDPQQYVREAPVLRTLNLAPPAEQRKFRDDERRRISELERRN